MEHQIIYENYKNYLSSNTDMKHDRIKEKDHNIRNDDKNIHLNTDAICCHIFINLLVNHAKIISLNSVSFFIFGLDRTILSTMNFN